ncbi:MAG: hypothetical protein OXH65_03980 [Paracoccaceae bacterium]|nr:hypothetical protein [Paracoccaceae bacterium]MDE2674247.1 hypothetical protein [Paracoccaceae bacterium]
MERLLLPLRWTAATACLIVFPIVSATASEKSISTHDQSSSIYVAVAVLDVVRNVQSIVATASVKTSAGMTPEAMAESKKSIDTYAAEARQQLDLLALVNHDYALRMHGLLDELVLNAQILEEGRLQVAQILRNLQSSRKQLIATTNWHLLPAAITSEDDLFYRLSSQTASTISIEDVKLYERLASLIQQVDQGSMILEIATRLPGGRQYVSTVEENLNLAMYQLRENIESLADSHSDDLAPALIPFVQDLIAAAYGEENLIELMKTRLRLIEQETKLSRTVATVSAAMLIELNALLEQTIADIELTDAGVDIARVLRAALKVQWHASEVASYSAEPTTANTPLVDNPETYSVVTAHISGIREELDTLSDLGYDYAVAQLRPEIERLDTVTGRIIGGRPELASALRAAGKQRAELRTFMDYKLKPAVIVSLDNQLYYMLTGRSEFRDGDHTDMDSLSHLEYLRYWHLASINISLFRTFSGLIIALIMTEPTLIGEGEERFFTASHRLERSIDFLEQNGGPDMDPKLPELARHFIAFGNSESDFFDSLRQRLPLIAAENELREAARQIDSRLQIGVDILLDDIFQNAMSY